jgi:hypothetical protein
MGHAERKRNGAFARKVAFAFQENAAERRMSAMQKLQRSNWIELESPLRAVRVIRV